MKVLSRKCIRLSEEECRAQQADLAHYENKLSRTVGGGVMKEAHRYDFNRGWEYALGRLRGQSCGECLDVVVCQERNDA